MSEQAIIDESQEALVEDETLETEEVETEETEEEGEEEETQEEDEEVEYEGKNYRVPRELKDALMRQADYTRKMQKAAELRKTLEQRQSEFEQVMQVRQQNLEQYANLSAMDGALQQYDNVDWGKWSDEDPGEAQKAYFEFQKLKDARGKLHGEIQRQEQETLLKRQQEAATRLEQGRATLAKDIPGWSDGMAQKLSTHGLEYGFTAEEMSAVTDPRAVKILHDAYLYRQSLKRVTAKPEKQAQPTKAIKSRTTGAKDPDKMSSDEWLKWRNKQLKQA